MDGKRNNVCFLIMSIFKEISRIIDIYFGTTRNSSAKKFKMIFYY